jgi:nitronate monooxygenase
MPIQNRLTQMLGIQHPVLLAPMDLVSGGRLAAAVSRAGGPRSCTATRGRHAFLRRSGPFAPAIRTAGAVLICQVQTVSRAREAVEAGADVIVAQGTEAGGDGMSEPCLRSSLSWPTPAQARWWSRQVGLPMDVESLRL